MTHLIQSYQSYKTESYMMALKPNNIIHFLYLYFFTPTYK